MIRNRKREVTGVTPTREQRKAYNGKPNAQIIHGDKKYCSKCLRLLPLDDFANTTTKVVSSLMSWCRLCSRLSTWYKLTYEQYAKILKKQGGVCAICKQMPLDGNANTPDFSVDHDHVTNEVRGLLCMHCNAAIGHFREDVFVMQNALLYLRNAKTGIVCDPRPTATMKKQEARRNRIKVIKEDAS